MRKCPYCDEQIEPDAFFCPHCGRETAAESPPQPAPPPDPLPEPHTSVDLLQPPAMEDTPDRKKTFIIIGVIVIPILLCVLISFCCGALTVLSILTGTTGSS